MPLGSYPRDWNLGLLRGQNLFFPNMVMWDIKLKGMVSRTGYMLTVHPTVKLVTLRWIQLSIIIKFPREYGGASNGTSSAT